MATEILQMAVDPLSLDTSAPLVTFGGAKGAYNMTLDIPLEYKDGRLPTPFRSGGYDPRLAADGLIGQPRTCKVSFKQRFDAANGLPNYRAIYDGYASAIGDGATVGLIFRTADGAQRLRYGRLLSMPWQVQEDTTFFAHLEMTFAVEFYSHDLFAVGAAYYDTPTATWDDVRYDTTGVFLPLAASTTVGSRSIGATSFTLASAAGLVGGVTVTIDTGGLAEPLTITNIAGNVITTTPATLAHASGVAVVTSSITFTTPSTAAVVDATLVLTGPVNGNVQISVFSGLNNSQYSSFTLADSLAVLGSGYIEYYQVDSGTQTVTKNGVDIFDQSRFILAAGRNDWIRVGKGTNTLSVAYPGTGLGTTSAVFLAYLAHYL
jgi:hypothetical protein